MQGKIIVGDIHGSIGQLKTLVDEVDSEQRPIIFLGDYVNRGPRSREVLDFLIGLKASRADLTFLCGNHDWAFLHYIEENCFDQFALLGGLETLASYLPGGVRQDPHDMLLRIIPEAHVKFLRGLRPYYEDETLMCSHTGVPVDQLLDRTFAQMVATSHPELFGHANLSAKLHVCGHYTQRSLLPLYHGNLVCLDTGCGTLKEGRLSALLFPEMRFVQVDAAGRVNRL